MAGIMRGAAKVVPEIEVIGVWSLRDASISIDVEYIA